MDELFRRYMYYVVAKRSSRESITNSIRSFYEKQDYKLLRVEHEYTFANLKALANFWNDVYIQNETIFSERVLKRLFVLNFAPNTVWTYIVSVYFLHCRKPDNTLDEVKFHNLLSKITAFIWGYTILTSRGIDALRIPAFGEMVNIIHNKQVNFEAYKFDIEDLRYRLKKYNFSGAKKITRSMLAWRAFQFEEQELIPITTPIDVEHICTYYTGINSEIYESLGNKSFIEKKIRDITKTFSFGDKRRYYTDIIYLKKKGTQIFELKNLAEAESDFTALDAAERNEEIIENFIHFIKVNNLAK